MTQCGMHEATISFSGFMAFESTNLCVRRISLISSAAALRLSGGVVVAFVNTVLTLPSLDKAESRLSAKSVSRLRNKSSA